MFLQPCILRDICSSFVELSIHVAGPGLNPPLSELAVWRRVCQLSEATKEPIRSTIYQEMHVRRHIEGRFSYDDQARN